MTGSNPNHPMTTWTPMRVAAVFKDHPNGLTINDFAAKANLSPTRASIVLTRALDQKVLDRSGRPYVYRVKPRFMAIPEGTKVRFIGELSPILWREPREYTPPPVTDECLVGRHDECATEGIPGCFCAHHPLP